MVNYKHVTLTVTIVLFATPSLCVDQHYDQRQNGSENYRLNIDGVFIAVAPADSLLSAASDVDLSELLGLLGELEQEKPKPPITETLLTPLLQQKPEDSKPQEGTVEGKPQESQSESSDSTSTIVPLPPLSDVSLNSDVQSLKKEASNRKQQKTKMFKSRLASILMPFLKRTRRQ